MYAAQAHRLPRPHGPPPGGRALTTFGGVLPLEVLFPPRGPSAPRIALREARALHAPAPFAAAWSAGWRPARITARFACEPLDEARRLARLRRRVRRARRLGG